MVATRGGISDREDVTMQSIEQLYDSFSQAADVAAINDRLADALADMGFARLAYRAIDDR